MSQTPLTGYGSAVRNPSPPARVELREFTETALHDMRGSLFVAAEFSQLLAEEAYGQLTPEQRRILRVIHDRTFNVNDVLESLDIAVKLNEGELVFTSRPCSIHDVLDLTIPRLLCRARTKLSEIRTNVQGAPALMECDPAAASLMLVTLFCHVAAHLDATQRAALRVERHPEEACIVFRFALEGGSWTTCQLAAHTEAAAEPDGNANAYLGLAAAIATEANCIIEGVDAKHGQLAGLAIPTVPDHLPDH